MPIALLSVATGLGLPLGCGANGPQRVPVGGKVLIDEKPVSTGTIRFVPDAGRPASSAILADGSFLVAAKTVDSVSQDGLVPGKYRVEVSASEIVDDETVRWHVPKKYSNFRTSDLEVTIDEPDAHLLIELTWGGQQGPLVESSDAASVELDQQKIALQERQDETSTPETSSPVTEE